MQVNKAVKTLILVISASCMAQGQVVLAQSTGSNLDPDQNQELQQDQSIVEGFGGGPGHGPGDGAGHGPGNGPGPRPEPPPHRSEPPRPPLPPQPPINPGAHREYKTIYVGREVTNEVIALGLLGEIGREFTGWDVLSVRAKSRSTSPDKTTAQLIVDGNVVAEEVNPGQSIDLIPRAPVVLGLNSEDLSLLIEGTTFIDTVQVELRRGEYFPAPLEDVEVSIDRTVFGADIIDLKNYIDVIRYSGRTVDHIVVTSTNRQQQGQSDLSFVFNGNQLGQVFYDAGYTQQQTVWLENQVVIGADSQDTLELKTNGDMSVVSVIIVLRQ